MSTRHCLMTLPRPLFLCGLICTLASAHVIRADDDFSYLAGRAMTDITGPAVGMPMFGFVRADQITEGIHTRQYCRTIIVAEPDSLHRVVLTTLDIGSVTREMWRDVLDGLAEQFDDVYGPQNVVITATHTHAGPGGFWHYGANTPIGSPFYGEFYDQMVASIIASIAAAHEDLQPCRILVGRGEVPEAGAQRSKIAYENNPAAERAEYDDNVDRQMLLLKFVGREGPIAAINWFAVHPTSMTFYNRLISGDSKGYAAQMFERMYADASGDGGAFVGAFAQSNCGDVTGNLNLDNTGPGENDFDSTAIIGQRQVDVAATLFDDATEVLSGPIDYRQQYVDLSGQSVADEFTGAGPGRTCPSAYGYAFAAGSTEDGGGHPLFREGMTRRSPFLDSVVQGLIDAPSPGDKFRGCQAPKAILLATGLMNPPGQPQVHSVSVLRLGQLALVVGPAEFTTMTGRRLRKSVGAALGIPAADVVIAGYANGYAGYVTTYEEYQTQQYEGGHTLFGPWTEAAYRQQFTRLAEALSAEEPVESGPVPRDIRALVERESLGTSGDVRPPDAEFGDVVEDAETSYRAGETVAVRFWSGNPQNGFRMGDNFLTVERESSAGWEIIATDAAWETRCRWQKVHDDTGGNDKTAAEKAGPTIKPDTGASEVSSSGVAAPFQVTLEWAIPADAAEGSYRIQHHGRYKDVAETIREFTATSSTFDVTR